MRWRTRRIRHLPRNARLSQARRGLLAYSASGDRARFRTAKLEHLAVDALLEFGAYPRSSGCAGKEPIRWRVLDCSDSIVLLLSDRILDCKRYHHECVETTWRDCDLRAWLNAAFFPAAFGDDGRKMVEPTTCTDNGDGAPDTVDSVFLLSVKQVRTLTDPSRWRAPSTQRDQHRVREGAEGGRLPPVRL